MAEGDEASEDRTESATSRRLDQARDDGQVAVSREVTALASLVAVLLVINYQSHALVQHFLPDLVGFLSHTGEAYMLGSTQLLPVALRVLEAVTPVLAAATLAGAAAVLLQTKFLLHGDSVWPKASRVSPTAGLKRMFGSNGLVEVVKSLGKLSLLTVASWVAIKNDWRVLATLPWQSTHGLLSTVVRPVFHLFVAAVCSQAIIAGIDGMWVRFSHARQLRMSKQAVRDESKDTDGNPHIKARIRRIRVMRARRRMMAKIPGATVVITNPTHYAVALAYDRANNPAPRIVAKGVDSLAARIRQVAEDSGVPLVANPLLARSLYLLELDAEIPAEHYKAVAEIIAYVWRLRQAAAAFP